MLREDGQQCCLPGCIEGRPAEGAKAHAATLAAAALTIKYRTSTLMVSACLRTCTCGYMPAKQHWHLRGGTHHLPTTEGCLYA